MVSWDDHSTHLVARLGYLLERQQLVDVTLMCNTHSLKVHRSVLAACSPYFEVIISIYKMLFLKLGIIIINIIKKKEKNKKCTSII